MHLYRANRARYNPLISRVFLTPWSRESTVPAAGTFSSLFLCEIEAGESARPILLAQMELELRATFAGKTKKVVFSLCFPKKRWAAAGVAHRGTAWLNPTWSAGSNHQQPSHAGATEGPHGAS